MILTPKTLWLLAGLATTYVVGSILLSARPQQQATLAQLMAMDSCLMASNQAQAQAAQVTLASMQGFVAENRRRLPVRQVLVLHQAQRIQAATKALTDTLRRLRQQWPGSGTPAAIARLTKQFGQYTDSMERYAYGIGPSSRVRPLWPTTNHEATAGLQRLSAQVATAALTRLEAQVRQVGVAALTDEASKVGRTWDPFESFGAFAVPVSNTVAPGSLYRAALLLAPAASGFRIVMQANSRPVTIDPRTNHGLVVFRVPLAYPSQSDTVAAQWQGQIKIRSNDRDSSFHLTVPYLIVKRLRP